MSSRTIDTTKDMATTQGAGAADFVANNEKHQTQLTAILRPNNSLTICSDSFWDGQHEQGIAFDMTEDQARSFLQWIMARIPQPISGSMVPVAEVIAVPCKGCGKRPIDFMMGNG